MLVSDVYCGHERIRDDIYLTTVRLATKSLGLSLWNIPQVAMHCGSSPVARSRGNPIVATAGTAQRLSLSGATPVSTTSPLGWMRISATGVASTCASV